MHFCAIADTDIGISKDTNQDSLLVKHAKLDDEEVLLAVVCDGMGGLEKGELASAVVIQVFSKWFDEELAYELENLDMTVIAGKWSLLLKDLNMRLLDYSNEIGNSLGTTFSGILLIGDTYLIVHVGDSRVYYIGNDLKQLTTDQTFIAREIKRGTLTEEQAKTDKRRNLLLQCIGASKVVEPEIVYGTIQKGAYLLCSDGFRHEITEEEMYQSLNPSVLQNKKTMHNKVRHLIDVAKARGERDNISAILIKVE